MKIVNLLIILLPTFLFSNFIGMNNGARSIAMGNAFVALSDESSAIFYNPAGLANISRFDLIASRQKLYGISDLHNDMIAISFPTPFLRTGLAVQQIKLDNEYSEQILYLSIAGIIRPIENVSITMLMIISAKIITADTFNLWSKKENNCFTILSIKIL